MSTTGRRQSGVCILSVEGDLSARHAVDFRAQACEALAQNAHDFIVDLADCTGVDSAGLEALTWLRRECDERLGLLKLCAAPETLRKVLEITRLEDQLEHCDRLDEALAEMA